MVIPYTFVVICIQSFCRIECCSSKTLLLFVVLLMTITAVRDSHSSSAVDFSPCMSLLIAFLALVIVGGHLGRSDSLMLPTELLCPGGPGRSAVGFVVSSLWWSDHSTSVLLSPCFATYSPPSVCCWKRCWRLLSSPHYGLTGSRPLPLLDDSWNPPSIPWSCLISSSVTRHTYKWQPVIMRALSLSHSLVIQGGSFSRLTKAWFYCFLKVLLRSNSTALKLSVVFHN